MSSRKQLNNLSPTFGAEVFFVADGIERLKMSIDGIYGEAKETYFIQSEEYS